MNKLTASLILAAGLALGWLAGSPLGSPARIGSNIVPPLECAADEVIFFDPADVAPHSPACVHVEAIR